MNREQLAREIYGTARLTGEFTLRSGQVSGEYFDKYLFEAKPALLAKIADAMMPRIPAGTEVLAGLEISNNRAVNAIRPFTVERKNWLFANTEKGAKTTAVLYSLIETAKANGINPFDYLTRVFRTAPNCAGFSDDKAAIDRLLPLGLHFA